LGKEKPAFLTSFKRRRGRGAEEQRGKKLYNISPLLPCSLAPLLPCSPAQAQALRDVVRNPGETVFKFSPIF